MPNEFLKESFRNTESLQSYLENGELSFDDLDRLIYQGVHRRNPYRPDHQIKNRQKLFDKFQSRALPEYLMAIISKLADRYIEPTGNGQLLVRTKLFSEWQDLITEIPPIFAVAEAIRKKYKLPNLKNREEIADYFCSYIAPQVRFSVLPSIKDPRLDELIARLKLDDLHIHLNGTTEIEQVWKVALERPKSFCNELTWSENNALVKELYCDDELHFDQHQLFLRLKIANKLRIELLNVALNEERDSKSINIKKILDFEESKFEANQAFIEFESYLSHIDKSYKTPLSIETLFLIRIFQYLDEHPEDQQFASALHFYLLLKCQFMRLIVQQVHNIGFEQFQKITLNQMRRSSEVEFVSRFHQMSYSKESDISLLEGRFAPSDSLKKNIDTLKVIIKDFDNYINEANEHDHQIARKHSLTDLLNINSSEKRLKLGLIAHFIKKEDYRLSSCSVISNNIGWSCRHYVLRKEIEKTRRAVIALRIRHKQTSDFVLGFDAAASELDASPDVFAPVFRRLRNNGYHNFTFHAGEDFIHLLSGIRAVIESVDFLQLKTGNRVGHATAIGINPKLWRERIGDIIVIKQGDRLDDLVLSYRILSECNVEGRMLHLLDSEIRRLSYQVYNESYSPQVLYEAWSLRYIDPILAFSIDKSNYAYIREDTIEELSNIKQQKEENPLAFSIFEKYHGIKDTSFITNSEKLVEVDMSCPCEASFTYEVFRELQRFVLGKLNRRHMAIEVLPTSNVRISLYKSHSEHHIFDWLGLTEEGMEVPVVLGSDDPGIFSTNLRNEYAHILIELDKRLPPMDAIAKLEQIVRNGKIWRFKKLSY